MRYRETQPDPSKPALRMVAVVGVLAFGVAIAFATGAIGSRSEEPAVPTGTAVATRTGTPAASTARASGSPASFSPGATGVATASAIPTGTPSATPSESPSPSPSPSATPTPAPTPVPTPTPAPLPLAAVDPRSGPGGTTFVLTFRELPPGGLYASVVLLPDGREAPGARGEVPASGTLVISYPTTTDTKVYPRGTYQYRLNAGGVSRAINFAVE